jgi:predicted ester cyclase
MSLEDNKVLVQRFIDEVMNTGNTDAIPDFTVEGSLFAGGIVGQINAMKTTFPDLNHTIDEIIAEGDKVVVRTTIHGTNIGPMIALPAFGRLETPVPPTGKTITHSGVYIFTVSDGKITSYASELDQIGLLRQMGWTFTPPNQT